PGVTPELECETRNWPVVMSPAQLEAIIVQVRASLSANDPRVATVERTLAAFAREWRGLWAKHGDARAGVPAFSAVRARFTAELDAHVAGLQLENGSDLRTALRELLLRPAVNDAAAGEPAAPIASTARKPARARPQASRFDRPIFIVCAPRSGSSLLFETLSQSPDL